MKYPIFLAILSLISANAFAAPGMTSGTTAESLIQTLGAIGVTSDCGMGSCRFEASELSCSYALNGSGAMVYSCDATVASTGQSVIGIPARRIFGALLLNGFNLDLSVPGAVLVHANKVTCMVNTDPLTSAQTPSCKF